MPRKTIIFGNGLGMAVDPEFFHLDRAIGRVWENGELLDKAQRQLIQQCLPGNGVARPTGEHELDVLQRVVSACEFLGNVGRGDIHWLSEAGKSFPDAIRRFIFKVAHEFHAAEYVLPETFTESLAEFLRDSQSHVATLNYDNLLYQPLIEKGILAGYDGALVDGFHDAGFAAQNMHRRRNRTFGYYLHLHGSPLFIDRGEAILKLRQQDLRREGDRLSSHIVLTHVKHKPSVITASRVLTTYWDFLVHALGESEEVILFGYSGLDDHLNALLARHFTEGEVRIVEWAGAGPEDDRVEWWKSALQRGVEVTHLDTILDFSAW